jgi:uncharacterized protein
MPEYLYRLAAVRPEMPGDPTPEEDAIVGEHFEWMEAHVAQGNILLAGRTLNTDGETFGITIFRAESDAAAQEFMRHDPAVQKGIMRAEVFPYRVALLANVTLDQWQSASQ